MSYTPDATVVIEPVDGEPATTAAAEFRTLKLYIRDVILAGFNGKASLLAPVFINTLGLVGAAPNITLQRNLKAGGRNSLNFSTTDALLDYWNIYQEAGESDLQIYSNAAGQTSLRLRTDLGIQVTGKLYNSDTVTIYKADALRVVGDSGYLSWYNAAGSTRTGYLQAVQGGPITLAAESANSILFRAPAGSISWDGLNLIPSGARTLGTPANRFSLYSNGIAVDGSVAATIFYGDGSQLTGISGNGAALTNQAVVNALGYTPYNALNPSNYLTGIVSQQVISALGFTPLGPGSVGTNGVGDRILSTSPPTGTPSSGAIWYQYAP